MPTEPTKKKASALKTLATLNPYLRRYRRELLLGCVTIIASNVLAVQVGLLLQGGIDLLPSHPTMATLGLVAAKILVVAAGSGLALFFTRQMIIVTSRRVEYDLRNDLFGHLQTLDTDYFRQTPTGDLMALATNDINAVRNYLGPGIMYSINTVVGFFSTLPIMLSFSPKLTAYALIPLPLLSLSIYLLGRGIHSRFLAIQEQYATLTTRAQENLAGVRVVRAYTREDHEIARFRSLSTGYLEKNMSLTKFQGAFQPITLLLIGGAVIIVVWLGGREVIAHALTIGQLSAFIVFIARLTWPIIALGWVVNIIQRAAASMGRLNALLDLRPTLPVVDSTDALTQIRGAVSFDEVWFRYPDAGEDAWSLAGVSFELPVGGTLAVVGATGSGKSTLVNLLLRLYDPTRGTVRIDGHDAREIPLDVLRSGIGVVPQDTFLFSDTLARNIAFGVDTPDPAAVRRAAEVAQLADDVSGFPDGFETTLGERGITLSGGQKQRSAIARAVLRQPPILILDDSLSAVDTRTEDAILSRLTGPERTGRTTILISHRVSTVRAADLILVLDDGRIVEQGTHDDLVALPGGRYATLNERQMLEQELNAMS